MKKVYQITKDGKKELEKELEELKGRRGEIADKIADARGYGDLSENAEYDVAREEQGLLETRIVEIEDILLNTSIIVSSKSTKVTLGSEVGLKTGRKTVNYIVVGPVEANPLEGRVSDKSPIGIALLGKKVGDSVTINANKGNIVYKIINIG
jgi:transcription elongation factor GreA